MKPRVKILYTPGSNCHHETAQAFKLVGAEPELCHLSAELITGKTTLTECDLLAFPGGFSFGDHLGAGRVFAFDLLTRLKDQLFNVRETHIPVIGICNGFQVLINTGLLPGTDAIGEPHAILDKNDSSVFESRWVSLSVESHQSIWTESIQKETLRMPVAHGEGRLRMTKDFPESQTIFKYVCPDGNENYPHNPNGSKMNRAGIMNQDGHILGLMPHPERAIYTWNGSTDGLEIFKSGVNAVKG